jgi:hypothetical protein
LQGYWALLSVPSSGHPAAASRLDTFRRSPSLGASSSTLAIMSRISSSLIMPSSRAGDCSAVRAAMTCWTSVDRQGPMEQRDQRVTLGRRNTLGISGGKPAEDALDQRLVRRLTQISLRAILYLRCRTAHVRIPLSVLRGIDSPRSSRPANHLDLANVPAIASELLVNGADRPGGHPEPDCRPGIPASPGCRQGKVA